MDREQDPKIQLAVHTEQIRVLGNNVETIMTNHLPHIQESVNKVDKKLAYWGGALAVIVVVAQFLVPLFLKR